MAFTESCQQCSFRSFQLPDPLVGNAKELRDKCGPFFDLDGFDALIDSSVIVDKDETLQTAGFNGSGRRASERKYDLIVTGT